jgi:hypothetical protein
MCRAASAWRRKPPVNGFGSTTAIGHEPDLAAMRARDIAGYRNAGRTLSVAFAFEPFAKPQAQCEKRRFLFSSWLVAGGRTIECKRKDTPADRTRTGNSSAIGRSGDAAPGTQRRAPVGRAGTLSAA